MGLWEINDFVWLVTQNAEVSYPMIVPRIFETATTHWHDGIAVMATAVLGVLRVNNYVVFDAIGFRVRELVRHEALSSVDRAEKWQSLIGAFGASQGDRDERLRRLRAIFVGQSGNRSRAAAASIGFNGADN